MYKSIQICPVLSHWTSKEPGENLSLGYFSDGNILCLSLEDHPTAEHIDLFPHETSSSTLPLEERKTEQGGVVSESILHSCPRHTHSSAAEV